MTRLLGGVLACAAWLLCAMGAAQSAVLRRPTLHWARSEDTLQCVDPRTLSEHVEELVGPVLVRAPEAEHTVEAQVARTHDGLRVQVRVLDMGGAKLGERTFEQHGQDCARLTPAIAFVIAMMIDPDVAAHGLPPVLVALLGEEAAGDKLLSELPPPPPPPPPAELEPTPVPRPQAPPPPPEEPSLRGQLSLLVRGALAEAPRAVLGGELRYLHELLGGPFALVGYVRGSRQLGAHELGRGRTMTMTLADFGVQACAGQASRPWLRLHGCLGVELAVASASGSGFEPDRSHVISSFGLVAQLTARVRVWQRFGLMLSLHGRAALPPGEIVYTDPDDRPARAYQARAVSGGVALGPSVEF